MTMGNKAKKRNTTVFDLRERHFQTSASMFFVIKNPLVFSFKIVCKTLQNLTTLYPKTCVTDTMSDSL